MRPNKDLKTLCRALPRQSVFRVCDRMIGKLTGRLDSTHEGGCILDVNGVGYLLSCSRKTLDALSAREAPHRVLVETHLRQDAITLFGFADATERDAFISHLQADPVKLID